MSAQRKGIVEWFATNSVAANILMLALILGGILGFMDVKQQYLPTYEADQVTVSVSYTGASPEEVEKGVILPIEQELNGMPGIDQLTANAAENKGEVFAKLENGVDRQQLLQDIRNAIARITSFPVEAEQAKVLLKGREFSIISIGVAAELAQTELYELSERMRRTLLDVKGVSRVEQVGALAPEISIEIDPARLLEQSLTIGDISDVLYNAVRDVPGGRVETKDGDVVLRTLGRREDAKAFGDIPIKTRNDGTQLLLRDIAKVNDGFEDSTQIFEFNGKPGMRLDVYHGESVRPIELAGRVKQTIKKLQKELPKTVELSIQNDRSERYYERSNILISNGLAGLALVVIALGLFLNARLAFWVAVSIPVVFIGSFSFLPYAGITLNMISMFAFILSVGIVVDDAIIVGEHIYTKLQQGLKPSEAVQQGVREMLVPVIYAVGTNIIAFIPLLLVPGSTGQFMKSLPVVASIVFAISLLEALLVLPSHLNHKIKEGKAAKLYAPFARVKRFHDAMTDGLDRLRDVTYAKQLNWTLKHRYLVLIIFGGFLAIIIAWYEAGRIDLTWRPSIPGNRVDAEIDMPVDASVKQTLATVRKVEAAGLRAIDNLGGKQYLSSWFTRAGWRRPDYGDVNMYLVPDDQRPFNQEDFLREWRKEMGEVPEAKSIFFEYMVGPGGNKEFVVNLSHTDTQVLEASARELASKLGELQGVTDVSDGIGQGKNQWVFNLSPVGRALGLTEQSLGQQIRDSFYGAEVERILRGGKEVKVMVRLSRDHRQSLADLREMLIRTPNGGLIPLTEAANIETSRAYSAIKREDGRRIIQITASIDKAHANSRQIRALVQKSFLPELIANQPELKWKFGGGRRDQTRTFKYIFDGLLWSAVFIFALMAALFRSYSQGIIVMLTIPFAVAGSIFGHIVMGHGMSSVSIYGMIALGGLVVNGSLVLTVRLNELKDLPALQAIHQAAVSRFRPILLTTLTTTLGLAPILFETSVQARFLIPMAIALSFGTIMGFLVVLYLIPAMYAIHSELQDRFFPKAK